MDARIAVTGIGLLTPIGCTPHEVLENLRLGRSGIRKVDCFDTQSFNLQCAGEVLAFQADKHFSPGELLELDRATQLGIVAAQQAWDNANLPPVDAQRIALLTGMSGAGQYQNASYSRKRKMVEGPMAALFHLRNLPHFQAATIAKWLHIHGPSLAFTCASGGSSIAIGHAISLLRAGRVDIAIAGGAESLTIAGALAMDTLQLCAPGSCSPFSGAPGMTLGEGAAFLVLERHDDARVRGAEILAELLGCAVRHDAYDPIAADPSGQGIERAMCAALQQAEVAAGEIDWIKASGCSTRDQDMAETIAIKEVFGGLGKYPPVSSLESSFGHANGAAGAIGLAAAILCRRAGMIPATLHSSTPRLGCDLDYVPNHPRNSTISYFMANTLAFGGGNVALVGGPCGARPISNEKPSNAVAITGLGTVTPAGCGIQPFLSALQQKRCAISEVGGFDTSCLRVKRAGLIKDYPRNVRGISLARLHGLQRLAGAAVSEALEDAGLTRHMPPPERIGLMVALSRGPAAAQEQFYEMFCSDNRSPATGRAMLKMGRFHVTSTLAHCFQLRGFGATISEGTTAGLHALIHAREILSRDPEHDAMVVIAADELSTLPLRVAQDAGFLAGDDDGEGEKFRPYDPESRGTILGEGAAAVVIERLDVARKRGAHVYATISGCGLTNDAEGYLQVESGGALLGSAIDQALAEGSVGSREIDLVYGHGRGIPGHDTREINALSPRFCSTPVTSIIGNLGLAEASCGLFSVAAAALGMQRDEAYPIAGNGRSSSALQFVTGDCRRLRQDHVLVLGSTENGANAALVLSSAGAHPPEVSSRQ
jgi:3-oxoacyl-[acyl-carrier-protein] synthase II